MAYAIVGQILLLSPFFQDLFERIFEITKAASLKGVDKERITKTPSATVYTSA